MVDPLRCFRGIAVNSAPGNVQHLAQLRDRDIEAVIFGPLRAVSITCRHSTDTAIFQHSASTLSRRKPHERSQSTFAPPFYVQDLMRPSIYDSYGFLNSHSLTSVD